MTKLENGFTFRNLVPRTDKYRERYILNELLKTVNSKVCSKHLQYYLTTMFRRFPD